MCIKNINKIVISRIDNIIRENFTILIGDADGVDSSIQQILANKSYKNVVVYCTGNYPRNNIGKWGPEKSELATSTLFKLYTVVRKDPVIHYFLEKNYSKNS